MKNGRNGLDTLSFVSIVVSIVLFVLASVIETEYYALIPFVIGALILAYAIFRILSTNTARRQYEEERFASFFKRDPYKRFKCPKCKTLCRVPKGRGKIKIHCPKCGAEFIKRT